MKLVRAEITGYKRLKDIKINLDEDLVALVGPNEAGKSSLLEALYSIENSKPFADNVLTRGEIFTEKSEIIKLLYALDDGDLALARETRGQGSPRWFTVYKNRIGRVEYEIDPPLERDIRFRNKVLDQINRILANENFLRHLNATGKISDESSQQQPDILLSEQLTKLIEPLQHDGDLGTPVIQILQAVILKVKKSASVSTPGYKKRIDGFISDLDSLVAIENEEHPNSVFGDQLIDRRPQFLFFGQEERLLSGDYPVDALRQPPAALRNLLNLAGIEPNTLFDIITAKNHAERESIQRKANEQLQKILIESWGQAKVYPYLQIESDVLRVMVAGSRGELALIAESSDGLRSFVALIAYIALRALNIKPILLIDEAEMHLHYDAQADLIRVFEGQRSAAKILYTTHSAGCLPSDLGFGVRGISQIKVDSDDTGISQVHNSFWTEMAGFSPLLIAMGASVFSFSPTRRAVLTEGSSDMILLPTLFREVLGTKSLQFQIAPGLASVSQDTASDLDLEAPRVCYLVDGDQAGQEHKNKLMSAGIDENLIVQLPQGFATEGFLRRDAYLEAVSEELHRSHGGENYPEITVLNSDNPAVALREWCQQQGFNEPNKTRIATIAISSARANSRKLVDLKGTKKLLKVLRKIDEILGIQRATE